MKANVKYTGLDVANRIRFDAEATFKQGATFTPTITPKGVLSWSNNGGLENPLTVNLRGPQGVKGDPGTTDYLQLTNRPSLVSLERNTAYAVGDVVYSKKLPAGYYLVCTTAGTTGNTEPDLKAAVSSGGVITDGSCVFGMKQLSDMTANLSKGVSFLKSINTSGKTVGEIKALILEEAKQIPTGCERILIMSFHLPTFILNYMNTDKVPNDNGSFLKIVSVANNISVNGNLNAKLIFYNYQDYGYWYDMIQATSFTNSIKKLVVCDSDGGTLINTRPSGDSTKYAASTEFVQNAIAAAFAAKGL